MKNQKQFALSLLDFHGGQNSGLYAVGSCMLSDSERGVKYNPSNHRGHSENAETCGAVKRAIFELRGWKKNAIFPECVKLSEEKQAEKLANRLEKLADEIWWENDLTKEACDFYSNPEFAQSEVDNG